MIEFLFRFNLAEGSFSNATSEFTNNARNDCAAVMDTEGGAEFP